MKPLLSYKFFFHTAYKLNLDILLKLLSVKIDNKNVFIYLNENYFCNNPRDANPQFYKDG